ncbi:MAG: non-canonical purine NTP pyrophosphatase [Patescibacteria group bacterium]
MRILLATTNEGKIREYKHLLEGVHVGMVTLADLGIHEKPEETGSTFQENAILKVQFYFQKALIPTLADDGGLEIDALGGEPGVRSRRWPGYEASDEELIHYALEKMKDIPQGRRTARFKVVLAIASDRGVVNTFEGSLEGKITENTHYPIVPGYPFRSIFYEFKTGRVLSELPIEELPNGHREQALKKALPFLQEIAQESRESR